MFDVNDTFTDSALNWMLFAFWFLLKSFHSVTIENKGRDALMHSNGRVNMNCEGEFQIYVSFLAYIVTLC